MTTKLERRKQELERHYAFLERLSDFLGNKQDGKKLSVKLLKLEREAHKAAEAYCNGEIDEKKYTASQLIVMDRVEEAFGCTVPGFFVNGDPRGYALKVDDAAVRKLETRYAEANYPHRLNFYRDMGGYGILSPEIEG